MKMDLSLLGYPKIKISRENTLFFNKYEYVFEFQQRGASVLRSLDKTVISKQLEWRRQDIIGLHNSWSSRYVLSKDQEDALLATVDILLSAKQEFKHVVGYDRIYFYTNDFEFTKHLAKNLLHGYNFKVRQRVVVGPPGTILLKKPNHKYRSYFRSINLESNDKRETLINYIRNQEGIRCGPALLYWINHQSNHWTLDHYFIDHNDMGTIYMLGLVAPRLVRRTLTIVQDK